MTEKALVDDSIQTLSAFIRSTLDHGLAIQNQIMTINNLSKPNGFITDQCQELEVACRLGIDLIRKLDQLIETD